MSEFGQYNKRVLVWLTSSNGKKYKAIVRLLTKQQEYPGIWWAEEVAIQSHPNEHKERILIGAKDLV